MHRRYFVWIFAAFLLASLEVVFIRDFNIGTLRLVGSILLVGFGGLFGSYHWYQKILSGRRSGRAQIEEEEVTVV